MSKLCSRKGLRKIRKSEKNFPLLSQTPAGRFRVPWILAVSGGDIRAWGFLSQKSGH
jgi:hypothetical protein